MNVKIVIIGAGVVGCLTAIKLKEEGFDVTIVDKSQLGSESTWAGAGILFPLMPWEYESRVFDLCKNASKFYKDFSKKLFQYTNIDSEYIESGLICTPPFDKKNILEWASKNNIKTSEYKYNEKSSYLFQSVGQIRAPRLMKSIKLYMKDIGINLLEETQLEHINNNDIKIKEWPTDGGDSRITFNTFSVDLSSAYAIITAFALSKPAAFKTILRLASPYITFSPALEASLTRFKSISIAMYLIFSSFKNLPRY